MTRLILPLICMSALAIPAFPAESLKEVLARLDKNAQSFQSMSAQLTQVTHTEIINENETQKATVRMKKGKNGGIFGRVDFSGPNQMIVGIREREVQKFYPKSNNVEVYDVGKYGDQLDQFLLLGFSTSGKDLEKNYKIKVVGTESIAGKPATHIELTPKSKEAQDIFKKADVWLGIEANHPVQEKIYKNEQDYTLINYSDVKLNPILNDKELELNLPPGVKKITPQK